MCEILKQFLTWSKTAPEESRALASNALARAYLYSELSRDDMEATEAAITLTLQDHSKLVRYSIADAFASCAHAPKHIILMIADDVPEVANLVLEHSPLLLESELVDIIGANSPEKQMAITRRNFINYPVSAALCEVGNIESCVSLIQNEHAYITPASYLRLTDRFFENVDLRNALLLRQDLPMSIRHKLVQDFNRSLHARLEIGAWLAEKATISEKSANDKITIKLADTASAKELTELVIYLRDTEQLTTELLVRAACMGNILFFEIALADLTNQPLTRIVALVEGRNTNAFRALCKKAGLPERTWRVFEIAVETWQQTRAENHPYHIRFTRKMVERVLSRCEDAFEHNELDTLICMLRKLSTEIAKEDAIAYAENHLKVA